MRETQSKSKDEEYQMKKYNRMVNKFTKGYYNKIYYGNVVDNILIFERPNGQKNCLNISGLDIHEDELNRYKNFFIYS